MTEDEVVRIVRTHLERQFPKTCSTCGTVFTSLADYLRRTEHVGDPVSYDGEAGRLRPSEPMGTVSFANCACGTTLTMSSRGLGLWTEWRLLWWGRREIAHRRTTWGALLAHVRARIDAQVLTGGDVADLQPRR